jgi:hypothetical protein
MPRPRLSSPSRHPRRAEAQPRPPCTRPSHPSLASVRRGREKCDVPARRRQGRRKRFLRRRRSRAASRGDIVIGSPGPSTVRPIPICEKSASPRCPPQSRVPVPPAGLTHVEDEPPVAGSHESVLDLFERGLRSHRRIIERDLRRSCSRCGSLGAGKDDVAVVVQPEAWVVRDLPSMPIEVSKGTGVPSVEGV